MSEPTKEEWEAAHVIAKRVWEKHPDDETGISEAMVLAGMADALAGTEHHAVQRERAEKAEARLLALEADLQGLGRGAFVVNGGGALDLLETARVNWQQAIDDCTTAETKRDEARAECKEKEAEITALLLQRIDLQTERDEARENYETAHRAHADAVHDKHVALRECEQAEMACAKAERALSDKEASDGE